MNGNMMKSKFCAHRGTGYKYWYSSKSALLAVCLLALGGAITPMGAEDVRISSIKRSNDAIVLGITNLPVVGYFTVERSLDLSLAASWQCVRTMSANDSYRECVVQMDNHDSCGFYRVQCFAQPQTNFGPTSPGPDVYVSITGSDSIGSGQSGNPWRTISHAVLNAPGSSDLPATIHVSAGVYEENVRLTGWQNLLGGYSTIFWWDRVPEAWDSPFYRTVIDGGLSGTVVELNGSENAGMEISGFTIQSGHSMTDGEESTGTVPKQPFAKTSLPTTWLSKTEEESASVRDSSTATASYATGRVASVAAFLPVPPTHSSESA